MHCREWGQIWEYKAGYCILLPVAALCSLRPRFSLWLWYRVFSYKQAPLWVGQSVRSSVRASVRFNIGLFIFGGINMLISTAWPVLLCIWPYFLDYLLYEAGFGSFWARITLSVRAHYSLWGSVLLFGTASSKTHFLKKSPIVRYISAPWMFRSIKNFVLWRDFVRLKAFLS